MIKDILESMQVVLEEILSMLCYQLFFSLSLHQLKLEYCDFKKKKKNKKTFFASVDTFFSGFIFWKNLTIFVHPKKDGLVHVVVTIPVIFENNDVPLFVQI